jgi:diguanylate cyclase (GGDEF)-like protein
VLAFAEVPRPAFLLVIAGALLVAAIVTPAVHALVVAPMRRARAVAATPPPVVAPVPPPAVKTSVAADPLPEPVAAPALTDPYTGLPDRRAITTALLEIMAHAERYGDPFSIAVLTLDLPGTSVDWNRRGAARMATALAETLRMPDKAGHYTDRSFLVLFPHTKVADAGGITERIRTQAASYEVECEGKRVPLKVTIGTAQFRKGDDLTQLLTRAEQGGQAGGMSPSTAAAHAG